MCDGMDTDTFRGGQSRRGRARRDRHARNNAGVLAVGRLAELTDET